MDVFPRCRKDYKHDENGDIVFQAVSWHSCDYEYGDDDNSDDGESKPVSNEKFLVKVFGVTDDGHTVSASITGFPPYFFIKVPHKITSMFSTHLKTYLVSQLPYYAKSTVKSIKIMPMKDFWGFQNGKKWSFVRITFTNLKGMRAAIKLFERPVHLKEVTKNPVKYVLYESNIEPFLRLIHARDLQPTGWIKIPAGYYQINDDIMPTTCQIDVTCAWACLQPVKHMEKNAPIMVAAFDLECSSSHGDFPVAYKDYKKVATDLYYYVKDKGWDEVTGADLVMEISAIFNPDSNVGKLPKVFTKRPVSEKQLADLQNKLKQCSDIYLGILKGRITKDEKTGRFVASSNPMKKDEILATLTARMNAEFPPLEGDSIIQIGVTVHQYGDRDCVYKHIITLGTCEDIPGAVVEPCEDELEMLQKFRDLIVKLDPDVMTGYNILGFDMAYLYERSKELGFMSQFMKIGRFREVSCDFKEKVLSSSALGDNILKYIDMHGRIIIDIMKVVQRDHKLDSYKLDHVANHFMHMNKHDVSPKEIFSLQKGSAADRRKIAEYCIQDCALCNRLIMKLEILANNIGMSNVCSVPLSYIFMRGQGIKIFSLVSKQCREDNMCIPSLSKPFSKDEAQQEADEEDDSGYEGAIVLEPKTGIYLDDPVSVLDYASLYPSSMISENLSHDCIVLDPAYDNLPGMEYLDISYDLYEGVGDKKTKVGVKTCRFVQLPNGEKGIIPRILMKLLKARKDTRKKMTYETLILEDSSEVSGMISEIDDGAKLNVARIDGTSEVVESSKVKSRQATYDEFQLAVLDGLQLAYKVTANSLYGQCGARTSQIYMKEIAACTTATGRKMILMAKDFLENHFMAEIVYGDSVTGDTPLLIRYPNGQVDIKTIESLVDDWEVYEKFKPWDGSLKNKEQGFINAQVWTRGEWSDIRRVIRHETKKKLYRVNTFEGCVDVTEDHSVIDIHGYEVKPVDCVAGLTEILHSFPSNFEKTATISLDEVDAETMGVQFWEEEDASVPMAILNASFEIRRSFVAGILKRSISLICKGKLKAQGLYYMMKSIGYQKIHVYHIREDHYLIKQAEAHDNKVLDVTCLEDIPTGTYVYDIETSSGVFQGGVGSIVCKNTDSIFAMFPNKDEHGNLLKGKDAIMTSIKTAVEASKQFKKYLKAPHDLEYEKTFWPFVLFSKKRYCANKYEFDDQHYKMNSMGIVLKRRDNANIVKKIYGGCLDIIMNMHNVNQSVLFLKNSVQDLIDGKYPLEDLVITKSLKADYKDPDKIAHKVLAERMGERDPGNKPQVNDRIPFAYVQTPPVGKGKKVLQGERIEHPDYIKKMNLKLDYEFYITNQISTPVCQLYALALDQLPGYKRPKGYWDDMHKKLLKDKDGDVKKAKERLGDLMENEAKMLLFDPLLTKLKNRKEGNQDITKWFKPV